VKLIRLSQGERLAGVERIVALEGDGADETDDGDGDAPGENGGD
jgi:hypothetical protein